MQIRKSWRILTAFCLIGLLLSACASRPESGSEQAYNGNLPLYHGQAPFSNGYDESHYAAMVPQTVDYGEKVVVVNPRNFTWGAYDADGKLIRAGIANAGADYCQDEGHPCRTNSGTFRVYHMGDAACISKTYPIGKGGSLMPYCMFFNNGQSLHGTPDQMLVDANISHGCIHMRIPDAEWLRYNFVDVGTKVVVMPY